ncbi:MAG: Uma2 family endonuclease [Leptolyngbyaceae cyanobacterium SM1_4_3]|nr:Uma2 family endonuclease [Leptolyngbyaceae cyanobacterium SM1_4_3]NJN90528.1 Uma2 family endonuclease [Leptolyngbyaceae cyanobacterium SL_5_14]
MAIQLLRRRFTVDQYHRMAKAGILKQDDRVKLIEGEIVEMSPIGRRHAACVNRLTALFSQRLTTYALVGVQNPVVLGDRSEPQPDLTLLKLRSDFYEARHPQPEDVLLIVEVADTTAEADREIKIPLYARNSILEVWLIDLNKPAVEVYQNPSLGKYQTIQIFRSGESCFISAFPEIELKVDELIG